MAIDKQANIKLENSAHYQELTKTNIDFYNRDFNTSVLNFIMTRNDKPMLLGQDNVDTSITLKLEDGSLIRDVLTIKDSINGILSYTLSNEMLQHTGKVTGQVEVAVKGKEDTVVQRLFSFNISESLIESIDAETKLTYIKKFADLESDILKRYQDMEDAFTQGEQLALNVTEAGNKSLADIETSTNTSLTNIEEARANGVLEIQTLSDGTITSINTHITEIEDKINQFNADVASENYVSTADTSTWQKYKLTKDNGDVSDLPTGSNISDPTFLDTLKPGDYYIPAPTGGPGESASGFLSVKSYSTGAIKTITYKPYNEDTIYIKRFYQVWSEWAEVFVTNNSELVETTHGSQEKADLALTNANTYTDEQIESRHAVLFEGTVTGVGNVITLADDLYNYKMLYISGQTPGGVFTQPFMVSTIPSNIYIQTQNLRDSNGYLLGVYEVKLSVDDGLNLSIVNDVSYDVINDSGSGAERNAFSIYRIEGWK